MPSYENARKTELFEPKDQEKYLIHSRTEIARVFKELAKRPDIITAYFDGGKHYLLTAVIGVLPERGLVVLDEGPNETENTRVLGAERVVCVTKHDNVSVKFTLSNLQRAKYQGDPVFAAPFPESVFRLQRREFFRISTPLVQPVTLTLATDEGPMQLDAADLSCGGIGLLDRELEFEPDLYTQFEGCVLDLPDHDRLQVDVEVRNINSFRQRDGTEARRIGCRFLHLPMDKHGAIQRYINRVQIEQQQLLRGR